MLIGLLIAAFLVAAYFIKMRWILGVIALCFGVGVFALVVLLLYSTFTALLT